MANPSSTLKISVIIPTRNSEAVLAECLDGLKKSSHPVSEIIVVSDGSTDNTLAIAQERGAKTIKLGGHHDANFCRNVGESASTGDVILFLDSDVIADPSLTERVAKYFLDETVDAVVGLYSSRHRHSNLASQYKNLWIRYSYLNSGPQIDWVFGAVTAIRRRVIQKAGGFNSSFFMKHGGEDLELGKRMNHSEYNIFLKPDLEVEHLKQHTLASLLSNDLKRSQGFVKLAGRLGQVGGAIRKGFVNVYPSFVASTVVSWLVVGSVFFGFWFPWLWWGSGALAFLYLSLNLPFLRFFSKHRGYFNGARVIGIMFLDHLTCAVGSGLGLFKWLFLR